jgi:hypothetical protein
MLYEAYLDWVDESADNIAAEKGISKEEALVEAQTKADFPGFLYGSVSTSLYQGYNYIQPQYRRYGRIENMTDFEERRIKGLNGITGIGYVGDAGEYPEMRRTERPNASLVIDTYGGVYSITRQTVINDKSGVLLGDAPTEMGKEGGIFVVETVIAFIESNPTAPDGTAVYHASRNNTTTDALSEDSLATAVSVLENQEDEDGRHIVFQPDVLAVKNARMEMIANRIVRSQETGGQQTIAAAKGAGTDVFDKGTDNPLRGIIPADGVIRDPYWTDSNNWYLFSSNNPAFAIGFLNGKEEPSVFLKNPEAKAQTGGNDPYSWEWDSVDFKVRLDLGVGVIDPRGTYRGTPA